MTLRLVGVNRQKRKNHLVSALIPLADSTNVD